MARGDILALRRAIGFGTKDKLERFVVVQNDVLSDCARNGSRGSSG